MFYIAAVILVIFTVFYSLLAGAIIYHLKQYTPYHYSLPQLFITIFLFLSAVLLLFALYFLFKIP